MRSLSQKLRFIYGRSSGAIIPYFLAVALVLPLDSHAAFQASASSSTSVTLTWTASGDDGNAGTANVYDIRYSTATITEANWEVAVQVTGEPSPQAAGSVESFTVENLTPGTSYYFAIRTADEVPNWSSLSNVVNVSTDPEQDAPAALADLQSVNPTDTSVDLTWTASGDDGNSGTASVYDIRYSTSAITEANWNAAVQVTDEPSPQVAGSPESFTVSGLEPGATYYFAVKVADEVPNWSGLSNVVSATTDPEQNAPATLTDLQAINATGTSVDLTWTATGDDGNTGTASVYDIRYSIVSITEANWDASVQVAGEPSPQVAGSPESFTVSGLEQSTGYYFAIRVADEVPNWSGLSNVVSATTADLTPPAAISDLQASLE